MISSNKSTVLTFLAFLVAFVTCDASSGTSERELRSQPLTCTQHTGCSDCINNGCSWTNGQCLNSCQIADAKCYSQQYFPTTPTASICRKARDNQCHEYGSNCQGCLRSGCKFTGNKCAPTCELADALCYDTRTFPKLTVQQTCRRIQGGTKEVKGVELAALGEEQTGAETVSYFEPTSEPLVQTKFLSVNSPLDESSPLVVESSELAELPAEVFRPMDKQPDVKAFTQAKTLNTLDTLDKRSDLRRRCKRAGRSCGTCLEAGCEWTAGECVSNCNEIADSSCYSERTYPRLTIRSICGLESSDRIDHEICSSAKNCVDCTHTDQLGGTSCQWYRTGRGQGYCGTGGCDMFGNCGSLTCPRVAPSVATPTGIDEAATTNGAANEEPDLDGNNKSLSGELEGNKLAPTLKEESLSGSVGSVRGAGQPQQEEEHHSSGGIKGFFASIFEP